MTDDAKVVVERAAQAFADANANPPFTHQLPIEDTRNALNALQSEPVDAPYADISDLTIPARTGRSASVWSGHRARTSRSR
jgi:hypothetical protein